MNTSHPLPLRSRMGVALVDRPRAWQTQLQRTADRRLPPWALLRNRNDAIELGPQNKGAKLLRTGTASLVAVLGAPRTGRTLTSRMVADWPIALACEPQIRRDAQKPRVSFVIPHRGTERLPHLNTVIQSLFAQQNCHCEIIIVDQDTQPSLRNSLPVGVVYVVDPISSPDALFNRSSALNAGARAAQGDILVLHDGDFVVPSDYASEIEKTVSDGYKVVNLKRFVAYLDQETTARIFESRSIPQRLTPEELVANLCGGGSVAIEKEAFWSIGGMDPAFVGWGGEDEEFWDRCFELKVWDWAYMPVLHLWHSSQPGKRAVAGRGLHTYDYFQKRMAVPRQQRVKELVAKSSHSIQISECIQ
jgi:hypothetical protein